MASSQRALASLLLLAQSHGLERLKFVTNVRSPTAKQVGCPYAQRVWMALELAEVDYERVEIDLRAKPDWFLEASPLGRVPCIIDAEGAAIVESMALVEYVDEISPGRDLTPAAPAARAAARALAWRCDARFVPRGFAFLCYGGRGRRDAFVDELRFLDDALRGRRFLAGDGPGLADVAYAPFVERLEAALGAHRGGSVRDISHTHDLARIASWLDALDGVAAYAATKCAGAGEIAAVYRPRATRRMSYLRQ